MLLHRLHYAFTASSIFKIASEDYNDDDDDDGDDDDGDVSMQCITSKIKEKNQKMTKRKTEYNTINTENLFDECSSILIYFLSKPFPIFDKNVTPTMTNSITHLQLSLAIFIIKS